MVMIANSDGQVTPLEAELLQKIGKELGLSESQITDIQLNPEKYPVNPPSDRAERFEQIVQLIQMVQIDGKVSDEELDVLEKVAVSIGYKDIDEVDVESILALIMRGEDTEVIVTELL